MLVEIKLNQTKKHLDIYMRNKKGVCLRYQVKLQGLVMHVAVAISPVGGLVSRARRRNKLVGVQAKISNDTTL